MAADIVRMPKVGVLLGVLMGRGRRSRRRRWRSAQWYAGVRVMVSVAFEK